MFLNEVLINNYDIVCCTESWLQSNILNVELFDGRYNVFRCDRSLETVNKVSGGGVLIAVRK